MPIRKRFAIEADINFLAFVSLGRVSTGMLIGAAVVGLSGCAKSTDHQTLGSTLVKVNSADVTPSQLNYLIRNSGDSQQSPEMIHNALETLIDQELVVQEAIKAKLDTDPDVVQMLNASRKQILADAYAQRLIYPKTPISEAKQKAYYNQHPELFAKRRWYGLQVFTIPRSELDPTLLQALDAIKTAEGMRVTLRARKIEFSERPMERSAEQLPFSFVKQFADAKPGDVFVLPNQQLAQLLQIVEVDERPVSFEDAQVVIENYLVSSRNREAMQSHIKLLRSFAQITYREDLSRPDSAKLPEVAAPASPAALANAVNTGGPPKAGGADKIPVVH